VSLVHQPTFAQSPTIPAHVLRPRVSVAIKDFQQNFCLPTGRFRFPHKRQALVQRAVDRDLGESSLRARKLAGMSRKTRRHGKGGSVGQHFRATPDLRSFDVPPAGDVTVRHPDGIIEIQPAQPAVKSRSKPRRRMP
jgi:hypothetical protein